MSEDRRLDIDEGKLELDREQLDYQKEKDKSVKADKKVETVYVPIQCCIVDDYLDELISFFSTSQSKPNICLFSIIADLRKNGLLSPHIAEDKRLMDDLSEMHKNVGKVIYKGILPNRADSQGIQINYWSIAFPEYVEPVLKKIECKIGNPTSNYGDFKE